MTEHSEYIKIWNDMAERCGMPVVRILNKQRIQKLKDRLEEAKQIGEPLEVWQEAVDRVEVSPWCNGHNDRNWKASIDYLLQESSFAKVLEGVLGGDLSELEKKKAVTKHYSERTEKDWYIIFKGRDPNLVLKYWNEKTDGKKPASTEELKIMAGVADKIRVVQ